MSGYTVYIDKPIQYELDNYTKEILTAPEWWRFKGNGTINEDYWLVKDPTYHY